MTELERLISQLEPKLRDAFLAAVDDLRGSIDDRALIEALRAGDIEAAIDALHISQSAFNDYFMTRLSGFQALGSFAVQAISALREAPTFRFDMTNPRAENKIRTEALTRVVGYTAEQIETARRVIGDGFAKGDGPQTIAIDVAGRINRTTGRREGGIIGLSDPQATYVENMRARLLSGDPREMAKVLGRFDKDGKWIEGTGMTLRDRRFDAQIKKAIMAEKPVPAAMVEKMVARYTDRLIKHRAETVARTDTATSVMLSRAEGYQQALDEADLPDEALEKTWRHLGGLKGARDQHVAMNNVKVQGIATPFVMPDGTLMQHSHDPAGGAKHCANCACDTWFKIDFGWGL